MKTLEIFASATGWNVRYVGDAALVKALGTDTLPLPFTREATLGAVAQSVKASNPGVPVFACVQGTRSPV